MTGKRSSRILAALLLTIAMASSPSFALVICAGSLDAEAIASEPIGDAYEASQSDPIDAIALEFDVDADEGSQSDFIDAVAPEFDGDADEASQSDSIAAIVAEECAPVPQISESESQAGIVSDALASYGQIPIAEADGAGDPPSPAYDPYERNLVVNEGAAADRRLYPRVAADESGHVYVAWMELRGGFWHIHVARSLDNGTTFDLDTAVTVGEATTSPHEYPDVAVGPDGTAYVAYQGIYSGVTRVYVKRSLDFGTSWLPAVAVDASSPGATQWKPTIAVAPSGTVHVSWTDFRYSSVDDIVKAVFASKSVNGGASFTPGVEVSDSRLSSRDSPDIAVSPEGNLYCAWYDNRNYTGPPPGSDYDIYFSRSTDGGASWSANLRLDDVPQSVDSYSPRVAAGSGGRVSVAWDYDSLIVLDRSADGGVTFGKDLVLTPDLEAANHQSPALASSADGLRLTAVWADERSGDLDIYRSESLNAGISFSAGEYALDGDAGTSGVYDVGEAVIDDGGNGVLDPGVLDGVGSTDRVSVEGQASLKLEASSIFQRLFYVDSNSDGGWDRGEDIVHSSRLPVVTPKSKLAYDDTLEAITDLATDDPAGYSFYYEVAPGRVMGISEWNVGSANIPLATAVSRAQLKVVYWTTAGYTGTNALKVNFGAGNVTTPLAPADTQGAEVTVWLDLKALGATTVGSLGAMDLTFANGAGAGSVNFDQCVLYIRIDVFYPGVDVIAYSGGSVEATNVSALSFLDAQDRILFHDADHDGAYDLAEPLVYMASVESPATLGPSDEVLARHGGASYQADMNQFPVNLARAGGQDQPGACQAGDVVFVVWSSAMNTVMLASSLAYVPPVVSHAPVTIAELGSATPLSATVSDDVRVLAATLYHSAPGETGFTAVAMSEEFSGVYEASLPGYNSTGTARYYIEAWDGTQRTTSPAGGPASPYPVEVVDTTPPVLSAVYPDSIRYDMPATVTVQAGDLSGIASVSLAYWNTTGGAVSTLPMVLSADGYAADIPPQGNVTVVRFLVNATDGEGNDATLPATGYLSIAFTDPNYPTVSHAPVLLADLGDDVEILANVSDDSPLLSVAFFHRLLGDPDYARTNMTLVSGTNASGVWSAVIPASLAPCFYEYYILVNDSANNSATHPVEFPPPHLLEVRDLTAPAFASAGPELVQVLEPLAVTAEASDNSPTLTLTLFATDVGGSVFASHSMVPDDGDSHDFDGDGLPTPGLFGFELPSPQETGAVIWYMVADDGVNAARHPASGYARTEVVDWTPPTVSHAAVSSWPVLEKVPVYATVSDNYRLESATLWSTGAASGEFYSVQMSELANGTRFAWIPAQTALGTVRYYIEADDGTNTTRWPGPGADYALTIYDDQAPVLMHDSPGIRLPFDSGITITLQATDNLGVSSLILRHSFNGAAWTAVPMEETNETIHEWSAGLPASGTTGELRYWFEASDGSNNAKLPAGAPSVFFRISVVDLDPPVIDVSAPTVWDIGTPLTVSIRVRDNLAVSWVRLHMRNGTVDETREITGSGEWRNATIGPFPEPTEVRWYAVASDGSSNATNPAYAPAERYVIDIHDLAPPTATFIEPSYVDIMVGSHLSVRVEDAHGVTGGELVYMEDGSERFLSLNLSAGDLRNGTISATLPAMAELGTVQYRFEVRDMSNRVYLPGPDPSDYYAVEVVDRAPPAILLPPAAAVQVGGNVTLVAQVTDNYRVAWVELWFKAPGGDCFLPMEMRLEAGRYVAVIPTVDRAGTLQYYVNASDGTYNVSTQSSGFAEVSVDDDEGETPFDWEDILWAALALVAVVLLVIVVLAVTRKRGEPETEDEPEDGKPSGGGSGESPVEDAPTEKK